MINYGLSIYLKWRSKEKMKETTFLKKRQDMLREPLEHCHDGQGALDWIEVLNGEDLKGKGLDFIHDDILPPGVSIGKHKHTDDEEYYYILSGNGLMTLDHEKFEVSGGDITAVYPGGEHGLENTGCEDMRIIVISVRLQTHEK
jgi:mannose-6-phosphate isomerase-like protein (cupin superfamily)